MAAIRNCVQCGAPYGDGSWTRSSTPRLGLDSRFMSENAPVSKKRSVPFPFSKTTSLRIMKFSVDQRADHEIEHRRHRFRYRPLHCHRGAVLGASLASHRSTLPAKCCRVLSDKCFVCHGPAGTESEVLRLDSFAAATRDLGGQRAIDPNEPEQSEMLARIYSTDEPMPPPDAEKQLTEHERKLLARWIRQGGNYEMHWSFIPPRKKPPADSEAVTKSEVVDAFVRARLQEKGIDFAPEADRGMLARRAALVLTGLPPEPEQVEAFLADDRLRCV